MFKKNLEISEIWKIDLDDFISFDLSIKSAEVDEKEKMLFQSKPTGRLSVWWV